MDFLIPVAVVLLLVLPVQAAAEDSNSEDGGIQVSFDKGGPEIISADGKYHFRVRGRLLIDGWTTQGSHFEDRNLTGTQARALRLGVEGSAGRLIYQMEADFADNITEVKGVYLGWVDRWLGQEVELSLGNRLTERSMEGSTGSDSTPFMERNAVGAALTPQKGFYGLGVLGRMVGQSWHLALQVAGDDINNPGIASDTLTLAGRAHWNPLASLEGLIHLGVWSFYDHTSRGVSSLSRNTNFGGSFNDTVQVRLGSLGAPHYSVGYGAEVGGVWRSLWTLGEYGQRTVVLRPSAGGEEVVLRAFSVSAGYFLTGEAVPYGRRTGTWTKPKVLEPVTDGGKGALELLARYDWLDYSSSPVGGDGWATTVGANWYLNGWSQLMVNWIHWDVDNASGDFLGPDHGESLGLRGQVSF